MVRSGLLLLGFLLVLALSACQGNAPKSAPPRIPVVPVSEPVERKVTDYVDFTGRTAAVDAVNVVPRVTGYLVKEPFKEGSEIKKGDLLFEVDPRPYKAQLDQAEGQVKLYEAQLKYAKTTLARDLAIAKTPGAVSMQQLDQDRASVEQAEASVNAAKASLEVYKLNLSFCSVTSPIDGQVGRWFLTLGNLVNQDQTLLTTVVSLDPMYAYFDMDEPTLINIRNAINQGRIKLHEKDKIPVFMALQKEKDFPHAGVINFVNNQVNPTTGSISVRAVFANPKPPAGVRLLSPGMFVRIHLPVGEAYDARLVINRAIGSDQGLKYVYVIDADKKVRYRRVTTGALQADGLRVITGGLKPKELVAVGALQQIKPGMQVPIDIIPMPTLAADDQGQAPGPGQNGPPNQDQPAPRPAGNQGQPAAATNPATRPTQPSPSKTAPKGSP